MTLAEEAEALVIGMAAGAAIGIAVGRNDVDGEPGGRVEEDWDTPPPPPQG